MLNRLTRSSGIRSATAALVVFLLVLVAAAVTAATLHLPRPDRVRISRPELFVMLATVGVLGMVGLAALLSTVRLVSGWLFRSRALVGSARRAAQIYVALGLLELGLLFWARRVEPFLVRVRHETLTLPGLRQPLRMVVISDMHSDARFDLDRRIAERINAEAPDVIVYLGDSLNSASRAAHFNVALRAMHARHAKLAVRGNWDVWFWEDIDLFRGTGFTELEHGWRTLQVGENRLRIGGHRYLDAWSPAHVAAAPPPGEGPAILLYHANDYIPAAARAGVDLYLCGDTHGGQLELPIWGPLFSVGRQGRDFVRGLYQVGNMLAYVTPGLGVERGLPLRAGVRPEITVLELAPRPEEVRQSGATAVRR